MINNSQVLKELRQFISIQSVSTDPGRFSQIQKAAAFLKRKLEDLGFDVKIVKRAKFPPLIIATLLVGNTITVRSDNNGTKTIGIYGHYDVQPEDPVDRWRTSPFKLTLQNSKFFGRGVADNKGSIIQNLASINRLIEAKSLTNNVVFILEGEEETGSVHFEEYVKKAKDVLSKINVFYVTDVGMYNKNQPQIFYGLRGLVYFELMIKIGEHDLHSGIYGNRVLNPAQVLADLLVKIKDVKTGKILIPYFYDRCRKIPQSELDILKKTLRSVEEERKNAGVYKIANFGEIHPTLASKISPSFDINGLCSGYTAQGSKTIIPAEASTKFSFRLVEDQNPDEIEKMVGEFIKANMPDGVKYELKTLSKAAPFYTDINNQYVKKTADILSKFFGRETLFNRSGGSVPAAEVLQRLFKKPIVLTGFILPDSHVHAPNENFDEESFWQGIDALEKIYGF